MESFHDYKSDSSSFSNNNNYVISDLIIPLLSLHKKEEKTDPSITRFCCFNSFFSWLNKK